MFLNVSYFLDDSFCSGKFTWFRAIQFVWEDSFCLGRLIIYGTNFWLVLLLFGDVLFCFGLFILLGTIHVWGVKCLGTTKIILDCSYCWEQLLFGTTIVWNDFCLGRLLFGTTFVWDDFCLGRLLFETTIVWDDYCLGRLGRLLFGTTIVWDDWFGGFIEFSLWLVDAVLRIIMRIIWPNPSIILNLIFLQRDGSTKP